MVDGGSPVFHLLSEPFFTVPLNFPVAVWREPRINVADERLGRALCVAFERNDDLRPYQSGIYLGKCNAKRGGIVVGNHPSCLRAIFVGAGEHASRLGHP
jgi:hypothetical protein